MGTMDPSLKIKANPDRAGYGDNTRCLRRDVNNNLVTTTLKPSELAAHILGASTIGKFQDSLQNDQGSKMAIHSSGHYSIWGDPGGDVFVSPGEPVFWLHHGQLDRHWWMWANYLDAQVKTRTSMYEGEFSWSIFFMALVFFFLRLSADASRGGKVKLNSSRRLELDEPCIGEGKADGQTMAGCTGAKGAGWHFE